MKSNLGKNKGIRVAQNSPSSVDCLKTAPTQTLRPKYLVSNLLKKTAQSICHTQPEKIQIKTEFPNF